MGHPVNKIALGTVQFGLDYGINNRYGQVNPSGVKEILACCLANGIDILDTAAAYGNSEEVLGKILSPESPFRVISKLPKVLVHQARERFFESLQTLRQNKLYGYLIHDFPHQEENPGLYPEIIRLREEGYIDRIGFSLYYPEQLEKILERDLPFQLVQIPFNVLDQRFGPYLAELDRRNVEVHVRSVFLQGLLMQEPSRLPDYFLPLKSRLESLHDLAFRAGIALPLLLLAFCHNQPGVSRMVVGHQTIRELETNLQYLTCLDLARLLGKNLNDLAVMDENMILPFRWQTNAD